MRALATDAERQRFHTFARSFFNTESYGGYFDALGPWVGGDRAYGIGQVMGANVPSWSEQYYGERLTPDQYLRNHEAQIAVLNGRLAEYYQIGLREGGDDHDTAIRIAAASWFGGLGARQHYDSTTYTDGYMSMRDYTNSVLRDYREFASTLGSPDPMWVEGTGTNFITGETHDSTSRDRPDPDPTPDTPDDSGDPSDSGEDSRTRSGPREAKQRTKASSQRAATRQGTHYFQKGRLFNR